MQRRKDSLHENILHLYTTRILCRPPSLPATRSKMTMLLLLINSSLTRISLRPTITLTTAALPVLPPSKIPYNRRLHLPLILLALPQPRCLNLLLDLLLCRLPPLSMATLSLVTRQGCRSDRVLRVAGDVTSARTGVHGM